MNEREKSKLLHKLEKEMVRLREHGLQFPEGKLSPEDKGVCPMAVATSEQNGTVVLAFGDTTNWIELPPQLAMNVASALAKAAFETNEKLKPKSITH